MPDPDLHITALVETFSRQLIAAMEASLARRVQMAIAGALGLPPRHGRSPRRVPTPAAPMLAMTAPRKTGARQLLRMPWFESPAGSSFGMTCMDLGAPAKSKIKNQRRGKVATPKVAHARQLQGQYLGFLRSLKGADRGKVQRLAKTKGVAEAVKLAQLLK